MQGMELQRQMRQGFAHWITPQKTLMCPAVMLYIPHVFSNDLLLFQNPGVFDMNLAQRLHHVHWETLPVRAIGKQRLFKIFVKFQRTPKQFYALQDFGEFFPDYLPGRNFSG